MNRLIFIACSFALISAASGQAPISHARVVPENLGLGLRQLVELHLQDQIQVQNTIDSSKSIMSDSSGRVVVNIYLNGKMPLTVVTSEMAALGLEIIAADSHWHHGVISAWLPVLAAVPAANVAGVQSVMLARRPVRRIGAVTAESSVVQHALEVNTPGVVTPQGILGRGITIGLVSDSYDTAAGITRASAGIASGDLPGPGNPNGYTQPVVVLKDNTQPSNADEGRAMAEIVHDIAPAARLAFSASGPTQITMAASIRNLRTSAQTFCDVIVDDISYSDEPFFSDGIIAQAVDDVVTSNSLGGKKVAYFSAAGNSTNRGYDAEANIISSAASVPYRGNLRFTGVPADAYAGGFQNFSPGGTPVIAMPVTTEEAVAEIIFQWNDPFFPGGITTDYNLLVFSAAGTYLGSVSGTDNSFATGQPIEFVTLAPNTTYQLVISKRSTASPIARHLRFIPFADGIITGPYLSNNVITMFGHATATNANAIAAYVYNNTPSTVADYNPGKANPPPGPYEPAIEDFSSLGGSLPFYFNAQDQRLASPEIRLKPDFAAADGVDTTFFPAGEDSDYDNNGFPNFFGTSAAAPNAAAFAALMLEAAGGPASLTPAQVRSILVQSALPHDLDPSFAFATVAAGSASVQVRASGDGSNESAASPNFFTVTFNGQSGETLNQLTIDLGNTALIFDEQADIGFPFTIGQNSGGVSISRTLSSDRRILTLDFQSFTPGKTISFGIDRDLAGISAGGNSADLIAGASISALVDSSHTAFGAFANQLGAGFVPTDGHGFIDARIAVESIVGKIPGASGVPANLSTRGVVGQGENVLIGGFIIQGSAPKKVIVRAIGPSLPVAGALVDPTLELFDGNGVKFAENNDWQEDPAQAAQIEATTIPPTDSRESARVDSLNPGGYTAIVRGANDSTGIALVEVYDLDGQAAAARLANIATRGTVQTGDNVMIGGFILNNGSTQIVVRALGPSLIAAGVSGVLADPALELRDAQGNLVLGNDNWQQNAFQAVQIQAIGLAPLNALESALTTSLNAGAYTTIVRGARSATGIALVEVYDLQ